MSFALAGPGRHARRAIEMLPQFGMETARQLGSKQFVRRVGEEERRQTAVDPFGQDRRPFIDPRRRATDVVASDETDHRVTAGNHRVHRQSRLAGL